MSKLTILKEKYSKKMVAPHNFIIANQTKNMELLIRQLNSSDNKNSRTLMDAGCGYGDNMIPIKERYPDFKLIGVDKHEPTISKAKKTNHDIADFIYEDITNLSLQSNTIDIVLSNQVIEHISNYNTYLSEITRVLKNKGLLIISTPNFHCPRNTFLKMIGHRTILRWENTRNLPAEEFRGHVQEFKEDELIEILEHHGFILLESSPIKPYPTLSGNWIFSLYTICEYIWYLLTKPFVAKGYSKNHNMIFKLNEYLDT